MRVVGVISGTSHDALDVAAAEFARHGETLWLAPLGDLEIPFPKRLRADVAAALPPHPSSVEQVCRLHAELGQVFAEAAARGVAELADGRADLVVSHGQTMFHWVSEGRALGTLQLGEPAWIARRTGLPVLADLRAADIARGGQGAPLAPTLDSMLLAPRHAPRAALNLGGIANLTVVRPDGSVLGYDAGPANALIDAASEALAGVPYDADGQLAGSGKVLPVLLEELLAEPYYAAPAPKSTGKELFCWAYLADRLDRLGATPAAADVVATATELTAHVIASDATRHGVTELIASGGGTRNPVLMRRLRELGDDRFRVAVIDELGVPSAAKEAYLMALVGYLSWHGLPGVVPSATGASEAAVLGSFTPGTAPLRLPAAAADSPRRLVIGTPPD
ncbi:MAG: anhydro-N-acetylmuramic acid kinase [Micromonosporaceae bacterium]